MDLAAKRKALRSLYQQFAEETAERIEAAVCTLGCNDCCIQVGEVYTTTLEGLLILEYLKTKTPGVRRALLDKIERNKTEKEHQPLARCAFLNAAGACAIYSVRPFSCRRLYSVRRCDRQGPTLHRQVWEKGEAVRERIHRLDDHGYGGHLSYILTLLLDPEVRRRYRADALEPSAIEAFARAHGLVINRWAASLPNPAAAFRPRMAAPDET